MNPTRPILASWGHSLAFLQILGGLLVLIVVGVYSSIAASGGQAQPALAVGSISTSTAQMIGKDRCPKPVRLSPLDPHEVQDTTGSWFVRCCGGSSGGVSKSKDAKAHHTATAHRGYSVCQTRALPEQQPNTAFFVLGCIQDEDFMLVCSWYPDYTRWVPGADCRTINLDALSTYTTFFLSQISFQREKVEKG